MEKNLIENRESSNNLGYDSSNSLFVNDYMKQNNEILYVSINQDEK